MPVPLGQGSWWGNACACEMTHGTATLPGPRPSRPRCPRGPGGWGLRGGAGRGGSSPPMAVSGSCSEPQVSRGEWGSRGSAGEEIWGSHIGDRWPWWQAWPTGGGVPGRAPGSGILWGDDNTGTQPGGGPARSPWGHLAGRRTSEADAPVGSVPTPLPLAECFGGSTLFRDPYQPGLGCCRDTGRQVRVRSCTCPDSV